MKSTLQRFSALKYESLKSLKILIHAQDHAYISNGGAASWYLPQYVLEINEIWYKKL